MKEERKIHVHVHIQGILSKMTRKESDIYIYVMYMSVSCVETFELILIKIDFL